MRQYAYLTQFGHPYFKKAFVYSVSFHAFLFVFSILLPIIPIFKGKRGSVTYSSTVHVDLVELPDQVIHKMEQNIISTRDAIRIFRKETAMPVDKDVLRFKTKDVIRETRRKEALEKLKGLETLEKNELTQKKAEEKKGNILSTGAMLPSAPSGEKELDAYRSIIIEKIKLRWALPSYLRKQSALFGEIVIFLNADGSIVRKQIVSSGNREFDEYMNQSLEEAFPFPDVPESLQKDLRYDGISITFLAGELK